MIGAIDGAGCLWRLRAAGLCGNQAIWLAQSLADSANALLSALRDALMPRLADAVLHELRNPLNALTLHLGLLESLLASRAEPARLEPGVQALRKRLTELDALHRSLAQGWFQHEVPVDGVSAIALHAVKFMRSHLSARGIALRGEELAALEQWKVPARALEWVLYALLVMTTAEEVVLRGADGALELHSPLDTGLLWPDSAQTPEEHLAGLALVLEKHSIALAVLPENRGDGGVGGVRLSPMPVALQPTGSAADRSSSERRSAARP